MVVFVGCGIVPRSPHLVGVHPARCSFDADRQSSDVPVVLEVSGGVLRAAAFVGGGGRACGCRDCVRYRLRRGPGNSLVRSGADGGSSADLNRSRADGESSADRNTNGQAEPPQDTIYTTTFKAFDAGDRHSCGLRADDTIVCWGNNDRGQSDAPQGAFKAVTAGDRHSCGLRTDDTIECWGDFTNEFGQAYTPSGTFKSVTAGDDHTCAVRTSNTIECWGNNSDGQSDPPGLLLVAGVGIEPTTFGL